jgi:hypothetical protein
MSCSAIAGISLTWVRDYINAVCEAIGWRAVGLFGSKPAAGPVPLDVLTPDYLISGQVEPASHEWLWGYFATMEKNPPEPLQLTVTAAASTGARPAPALLGTTASFAYATALIALIPRGEAADALFEEWSTTWDQPLAAEMFVGPYAISGSFLTGGSMAVVIGDRVAARDVTFTRIDGAGAWGPVQAPRAVVATALLQTAAVAGPLIQ